MVSTPLGSIAGLRVDSSLRPFSRRTTRCSPFRVGVGEIAFLFVTSPVLLPRIQLFRRSYPLTFFSPALLRLHSVLRTRDRRVSPPLPTKGRSFRFDSEPAGLDEENIGFIGEKRENWTVVLIGWMGGEMKTLMRCAGFLYGAKRIRTVRFAVPAEEFLRFIMQVGRSLEEQVDRFVRKLA